MVGKAFAMLHDDLRPNPSNPKVHMKLVMVAHIWVLIVLCSVEGEWQKLKNPKNLSGNVAQCRQNKQANKRDKKTKQKK